MKILFLNPKIDTEHKISVFLQEKGAAVLFPADSKEAIQTLQVHGTSVDLAILNAEGHEGPDTGAKLIHQIKQDPIQADLPIILTTDTWSEADCATHQNGPEGINAYLRSPYSESQLLEVIEAVTGAPLSASSGVPEPPGPKPMSVPKSKPPAQKSAEGIPVLEDGSAVFLREEVSGSTDLSIVLEAPEEAPPPTSESSIPTAEIPTTAPPSEEPLVPTVFVVETEAPFETPDMVAPEQSTELDDIQVAEEMPYLFSDSKSLPTSPRAFDPALLFAEPLGDAVVPGGAAQTPDLETVKKYLLLREQDVAVLSTQLKAAQDQIKMNEHMIREERAKNAELTHVVHEQKQKIEDFEKEKTSLIESLQNEISELRFQIKAKTDKGRVLEIQVREVSEEMEHLKDRVRTDIRKIRVREKELENRIEIMKKDSEALIGARENKIIELKRKLDLLEFNMDLLQDQHSREKEKSAKLRERLARAAQVVRVAGGLLDSPKGAGASELLSVEGEEGEASKEEIA